MREVGKEFQCTLYNVQNWTFQLLVWVICGAVAGRDKIFLCIGRDKRE